MARRGVVRPAPAGSGVRERWDRKEQPGECCDLGGRCPFDDRGGGSFDRARRCTAVSALASALRTLGAEDLLGPVADPLGPDADRFLRFEAVSGCLSDAAIDRQGLLVVLEDFHRADDSSVQLLVHVAESLRSVPLCVVVTARDHPVEQSPMFATVVPALSGLPGSRRVDLEGLDVAGVGALLGSEVDDSTVARVSEATGGNPFFVVELARHRRNGGDLGQVPKSVREVVRSRVAGRSARCVEVLRVAAVVGREFAAGVIVTALGVPAMEVLEAIEEAGEAGLVEPTGVPGQFRFVHVAVRDAVEADLGPGFLASAHRRVALAMESYEGAGDEHLSDLARHWDASADLGERPVAAQWCERAAVAADARLAWEDAARLFDRAVALGGADADPLDRYRRLLGAARARLHFDDIGEAVDRCVRAADTVRALGRVDLLAEAALVVEARGGPPLAKLRDLAVEALAGCDDADHTTTARLLGQLVTCAFYLDPSAAEPLSGAAMKAASLSGDPVARIAAARARQMALPGPESAGERLALASVMGDAGRELRRPTVVQWESIWRIDALLELGRLPEAIAELVVLRQGTDEVRHPITRWHLARCESLLAQATGRFADAQDWCEQTCQVFARIEDERGAAAMGAGFATVVGLHTGFAPELVERWDAIDLSQAPPFLGDLPILDPLIAVLGIGDTARAQRLYGRLAPVEVWHPPAFLWLHLHATRVWAAIALGHLDDVEPLVAALDRHRGTHVAAGAGGMTYAGPVELWTGIGQRALGRLDAAVADLRDAHGTCTRNGAAGFAVHAGTELAHTLQIRGGPDDSDEARALVADLTPAAEALGMTPWIADLHDLHDRLTSSPGRPGLLSPREEEVAALVARGLTNRAIARELYVSERTAQNHVQHVLTKLGLSNRTQIAAWYARR